MARLCSICTSQHLTAVDIDLAGGRSCQAVARTYRLSADSVRRHKRAHLSANLSAVAVERAVEKRARDSAAAAYVSIEDRLTGGPSSF